MDRDATSKLVDALCDPVDPVLAYRARRRLRNESPTTPAMKRLRGRIRSSERALALLSHLCPDGRVDTPPYKKWQGPHWTMTLLAELAYPAGDKRLYPLRDQVLEWLLAPRFLRKPSTFIFEGQEDRPRRCVSMEANALWSHMELGLVCEGSAALRDRLIGFQWPDGGWNCDRSPKARSSSVQETLLPIRTLHQWGVEMDDDEALAAARRGARHLLERRLLWRKRDGALMQPSWGGAVDIIHWPIRFYDLLFPLLVMSDMGLVRLEACSDALDLLHAKRLAGGGFPAERCDTTLTTQIKSRGSFANWGPRGKTRANPFVTIDALHVLRAAGRIPDWLPKDAA